MVGKGMVKDEDRYEMVCKSEFAEIKTTLKAIDVAIRGNGQPGIQVRLDRLETSKRGTSKLLWMLVGAGISIVTGVVMKLLK